MSSYNLKRKALSIIILILDLIYIFFLIKNESNIEESLLRFNRINKRIIENKNMTHCFNSIKEYINLIRTGKINKINYNYDIILYIY